MCHRGAGHHQIGAHPVDVESCAQRRDPIQFGIRQHHLGHQSAGGGDPLPQFGVGGGVALCEPDRVGLVGQPGPDHLAADRHVAGGRDVDGQAEPVQQLRTQFALFGIHRADQHEPRIMGVRDTVALDVHPAHRGGVEQDVDEVVGQQVDFVDVEHAAVRTGQQPRREGVLAVAQHLLQVQRSDHPVLGGADREFDEP